MREPSKPEARDRPPPDRFHGAPAQLRWSQVQVILPVKSLARAKLRLAAVLTAQERRLLVLTMLRDVIRAVRHAGFKCWVVSPDALVLATAAQAGVRTLREAPPVQSLNGALEWAIAVACRPNDAALVILPDTPLVNADELHAAVTGLRVAEPPCSEGATSGLQRTGPPRAGTSAGDSSGAVLLAPDRRNQGTNALLAHPAKAIVPAFGPASLALHRESALQRHVAVEIAALPGLAYDLDDPLDLLGLVAAPGTTLSQRLLRRLAIEDRFRRGQPSATKRDSGAITI
jgi:2-phospho-L-lactate guanylyltransferase